MSAIDTRRGTYVRVSIVGDRRRKHMLRSFLASSKGDADRWSSTLTLCLKCAKGFAQTRVFVLCDKVFVSDR